MGQHTNSGWSYRACGDESDGVWVSDQGLRSMIRNGSLDRRSDEVRQVGSEEWTVVEIILSRAKARRQHSNQDEPLPQRTSQTVHAFVAIGFGLAAVLLLALLMLKSHNKHREKRITAAAETSAITDFDLEPQSDSRSAQPVDRDPPVDILSSLPGDVELATGDEKGAASADSEAGEPLPAPEAATKEVSPTPETFAEGTEDPSVLSSGSGEVVPNTVALESEVHEAPAKDLNRPAEATITYLKEMERHEVDYKTSILGKATGWDWFREPPFARLIIKKADAIAAVSHDDVDDNLLSWTTEYIRYLRLYSRAIGLFDDALHGKRIDVAKDLPDTLQEWPLYDVVVGSYKNTREAAVEVFNQCSVIEDGLQGGWLRIQEELPAAYPDHSIAVLGLVGRPVIIPTKLAMGLSVDLTDSRPIVAERTMEYIRSTSRELSDVAPAEPVLASWSEVATNVHKATIHSKTYRIYTICTSSPVGVDSSFLRLRQEEVDLLKDFIGAEEKIDRMAGLESSIASREFVGTGYRLWKKAFNAKNHAFVKRSEETVRRLYVRYEEPHKSALRALYPEYFGD